ncbi:MAG: PilZ domain-containing protein [Candidatus Electrothrix sp. YB6]
MNNKKRQFTRIPFRRPVTLDFGKKKYECSVKNFSLSGMYVLGKVEQQEGDMCEIRLSISETNPVVTIKAVCTVARKDRGGLGLKFTSMEPQSFLFLQEVILYESNAHWCPQPGNFFSPLFNWKMT